MKEIKKTSTKNTTGILDNLQLSNNPTDKKEEEIPTVYKIARRRSRACKMNTKQGTKDGKQRIDHRKIRSEIDQLGEALIERIDKIVETKKEMDDEQKSKALQQVYKIKQIISKIKKKHGCEAKQAAFKRQTKKKTTNRVKSTKKQSMHKQ